MMAAVRAFGFARYFVATPLAAPVRIWPSASASMSATISPVVERKSDTTKRATPRTTV